MNRRHGNKNKEKEYSSLHQTDAFFSWHWNWQTNCLDANSPKVDALKNIGNFVFMSVRLAEHYIPYRCHICIVFKGLNQTFHPRSGYAVFCQPLTGNKRVEHFKHCCASSGYHQTRQLLVICIQLVSNTYQSSCSDVLFLMRLARAHAPALPTPLPTRL